MTQPSAIRLFELLFLAALALTVAGAVLVWPEMVDRAAASAGAARLGGGALNAIVAVGVGIGAVLMLLLWFFVARRGSTVAKWLTVLFAIYGVYELTTSMQAGATWGNLSGALSAAATVLQVVAVAALFTPGARAWFAGETVA